MTRAEVSPAPCDFTQNRPAEALPLGLLPHGLLHGLCSGECATGRASVTRAAWKVLSWVVGGVREPEHLLFSSETRAPPPASCRLLSPSVPPREVSSAPRGHFGPCAAPHGDTRAPVPQASFSRARGLSSTAAAVGLGGNIACV